MKRRIYRAITLRVIPKSYHGDNFLSLFSNKDKWEIDIFKEIPSVSTFTEIYTQGIYLLTKKIDESVYPLIKKICPSMIRSDLILEYEVSEMSHNNKKCIRKSVSHDSLDMIPLRYRHEVLAKVGIHKLASLCIKK